MLRIGIVDIDTSHPGSFIPILRSIKNVDITAVWDAGDIWDDSYVKDFAKEHKIQNVISDIEDMFEHVDAVMVQSANWDCHIDRSMPFIERGIPVLIDKPVVGSYKDIKRMKKIVREHSSIIFGGSSLLYQPDAIQFARSLSGEYSVVHAFGMGDIFNYGIHTVAIAQTLLGVGAKSIVYLNDDDHPSFRIDFISDKKLYLHLGLNMGYWSLVVHDKEEQKSLTIDTSNLYQPFLESFVSLLKNDKAYNKSFMGLPLEASTILLGAKLSMEEKRVIELSDLPDTTRFDGRRFLKEYRKLRLGQWRKR